jgi:hypothetical protein
MNKVFVCVVGTIFIISAIFAVSSWSTPRVARIETSPVESILGATTTETHDMPSVLENNTVARTLPSHTVTAIDQQLIQSPQLPQAGGAQNEIINRPLVIQAGAILPRKTVGPEVREVSLLRFVIANPNNTPSVVVRLSIGSVTGNDLFNYIENMKVVTDDDYVASLRFDNRYHNGLVLWNLSSPLLIPAGESRELTFYADTKPGLPTTETLLPIVTGGVGSHSIEGSTIGSSITFIKD